MFITDKIEKACISFRIGPSQWLSEKRFNELFELFEKYNGLTDEITLFVSDTHAPLHLEYYTERCGILAERIEIARTYGYKTGINVLTTIGHHEENLSNSLDGTYTPMTDIKGNICKGSFCPNDENMREYIRQLYEILITVEPEFIWIDDDVRLFGHLPIKETCFCDNCIDIFHQESGVQFSRESINNAFDSIDVKTRLKFRRKWIEHNRNTVARLLGLIESSVHRNCPEISLGFMSGERFYEGYDFDNWAKILSGSNCANAMWRPGGGFYSEEKLTDMIQKSHEIGRQVSLLPNNLVSIQSEIENFPYQRLRKSAFVTAIEAASHIAAGCTGAAFNVLSLSDEPLNEYESLVKTLHNFRPFYDLLVRHLGRFKPQGLYTGWNKDGFTLANIAKGQWFEHNNSVPATAHGSELFEIGLPPAYSPNEANVTILSGDSVLLLSDDELKTLLSSGVYMDAKALMDINRRGLGKFTGFTEENCFQKDCIEQLIDHPFNSCYSGRCRDGRLSFSSILGWPDSAYSFQPTNSRAEILARVIDYNSRQIASCCMGIFENELGGRICVAGYFPWHLLQSQAKSSQAKCVMEWLSKDSLLAYTSSYHKVNIWTRRVNEGQIAVVILNSSMDEIDNMAVDVLTRSNHAYAYNMDCKETIVHSVSESDVRNRFTLPTLRPWHMQLLIINEREL